MCAPCHVLTLSRHSSDTGDRVTVTGTRYADAERPKWAGTQSVIFRRILNSENSILFARLTVCHKCADVTSRGSCDVRRARAVGRDAARPVRETCLACTGINRNFRIRSRTPATRPAAAHLSATAPALHIAKRRVPQRWRRQRCYSSSAVGVLKLEPNNPPRARLYYRAVRGRRNGAGEPARMREVWRSLDN